ncbi:fluoroquinolone transport system permease protein [Acetoanaerobium pronyense]|uniref:Fluoroquinolone transport system permease protein n=1 Tax=Acetoanaerobium pronyense TaxID=1482736 RepID=A0ABS4KMB6_9FIRM|nr:ABC transporter permease [Acetoanaerobium pronyense]MBP2028927.1 fluoroquinolone transport system permease protein [Acetoanaerobium pronyense]
MYKLLNLVKWDIKFQLNNGLYVAGAILSLVWLFVLILFPSAAMAYVIPIVILSDVGTMGMLFIGAIVFFEKGQGSIKALVVTPMKPKTYIQAKVISLLCFVMLATFFVILGPTLIKGVPINLIIYPVAVTIIATSYILLGFILSAYFKSFTDFIFPMCLVFMVLNLPLLFLFDISDLEPFRRFVYLLPSHGMVILLKGMFEPQTALDLTYAVIYNLIIIKLLYLKSIKVFNQKVIGRQGDFSD